MQFYFIKERILARNIIINYISISKQYDKILIKLLEIFTYYCMCQKISILPICNST